MSDPVTIAIGLMTFASAAASPAAFYHAGKAAAALGRLRASEVGGALERVYADVLAEEVPPELIETIARLD
jgi:hypothetical protein